MTLAWKVCLAVVENKFAFFKKNNFQYFEQITLKCRRSRNIYNENIPRAGKMVQEVRMLAVKHDYLCWIQETHVVEEET